MSPGSSTTKGRSWRGLAYLDDVAAKVGDGWLAGTDRISQADVSAVVSLGFADRVRPNLKVQEKFPNLAKFAARCEAMDEFFQRNTLIKKEPRDGCCRNQAGPHR